MRWTDVNSRAGIARFYRQIPVRTGKCIEDPYVAWEVLTIIGGPRGVGGSNNACGRYAKEVRNPPQALVYKADKYPSINTQKGSEDIVFIEVDTK